MFLYDNHHDLAPCDSNRIEFANLSGFNQSQKKFKPTQKIGGQS